MRLKYKFVTRNVAGQCVALAVGEDNAKFNGMIKLNEVGEFIFKLLEIDISFDEIVSKVLEEYDVSQDDAKEAVENYIKVLNENNLLEQ